MKVLKPNEISSMHNDKYAVVDFFATWCGPCAYMEPFYKEAEKELNELGAVCYKVDVDECEKFAIDNRIQFVPTVILYNYGKEMARFNGSKNKQGIIDFVKQSINGCFI